MDKNHPAPAVQACDRNSGPLIVFFTANAKFNLFVATGAFMVAIVAALIVSYCGDAARAHDGAGHRHHRHRVRHADPGAARLKLLSRVKPYHHLRPCSPRSSAAGCCSAASFIAIMFDQMFNLTPQGWRILTMRWALFFFRDGDPE